MPSSVIVRILLSAALSAAYEPRQHAALHALVDIESPSDATIFIDGVDNAGRRHIELSVDETNGLSSHNVVARFRDGETTTRKLFLKADWHAYVPLFPSHLPWQELVVPMGHDINVAHSMGLSSVAFSSDGRRVLTSSDNSTAVLWDAASGRELRHYRRSTGGVFSVAFNPDGRHVLMGQADGTATILETATGIQARVLRGHHGSVRSVAVSSDGRIVITGSDDANAAVWNARTGEQRRILRGHTSAINSVTISADGLRVITGSDDTTAIVWNTTTGAKLQTLRGEAGAVDSVAFSPDGKHALTGSGEGVGTLWNTASGRRERELRGHEREVNSVAISPDGRYALTGSSDTTARLWQIDTGKPVRTFQWHGEPVCAVAFSPDGRRVLTGLNDSNAVVWDAATGVQVRVLRAQVKRVLSVASHAGRGILTGLGDGTCVFWDPAVCRQGCSFKGQFGAVTSVAFSSDGKWAIAGSLAQTAVIWDIGTGNAIRGLHGHSDGVLAVAFSPDRRRVLTGSADQTAMLWDVATGQPIRVFKAHTGPVQSVAFSPDGRSVLTGSSDGMAILWNEQTAKRVLTFRAHAAGVRAVAFHPDGRTVLTGSTDTTAVIWDAATGSRIREFRGHDGPVTCVAFALDGRYALTASWDATAALWDSKTGEQIRAFRGHSSCVNSIAFDCDDRVVITGSSDGTTRVWDVATGDHLASLVFVSPGQEWLVITPEGLFDGSAGARRTVACRMGNGLNVVPVDRFFHELYRPGLLAQILRGERPLPGWRDGERAPPELKIIAPVRKTVATADVVVEAVARDRGGGIANLRVFHQGARVKAAPEARGSGKTVGASFPITLVDGTNRIDVVATNADGSWEAEPARIELEHKNPASAPRLFLLAVGVNEYPNPQVNPRYAMQDAIAVDELFRKRTGSSYRERRTTVLLDAKATRSAILERLKALAAETAPEDALIVFFAGRGLILDQRFCLVPHDAEIGDEQTQTNKRGQVLSCDDILDTISGARALKRLVILDTRATLQQPDQARTANLSASLSGAVERLTREYGIYTIAALTADEADRAVEPLGHGVLTHALLAGVGAVDAQPINRHFVLPVNAQQMVDVRDWLSFAADDASALREPLFGSAGRILVANGSPEDCFPIIQLAAPGN